jgi:hypothetical protein
MTQLMKYHLQLTSSQTLKWRGGTQISQSQVKACWVTSFTSQELPVTKFLCRTLKQSSQLFLILYIPCMMQKFNLSNQPYMHWNVITKDSQSPTCFSISWVMKHAGDCVSLAFTFQCKKGWFDKLKPVILQVRNIYSHTCKINRNNKQTNNKCWARRGFCINTMYLSTQHFEYAASGQKRKTSTRIFTLMSSPHAMRFFIFS